MPDFDRENDVERQASQLKRESKVLHLKYILCLADYQLLSENTQTFSDQQTARNSVDSLTSHSDSPTLSRRSSRSSIGSGDTVVNKEQPDTISELPMMSRRSSISSIGSGDTIVNEEQLSIISHVDDKKAVDIGWMNLLNEEDKVHSAYWKEFKRIENKIVEFQYKKDVLIQMRGKSLSHAREIDKRIRFLEKERDLVTMKALLDKSWKSKAIEAGSYYHYGCKIDKHILLANEEAQRLGIEKIMPMLEHLSPAGMPGQSIYGELNEAAALMRGLSWTPQLLERAYRVLEEHRQNIEAKIVVPVTKFVTDRGFVFTAWAYNRDKVQIDLRFPTDQDMLKFHGIKDKAIPLKVGPDSSTDCIGNELCRGKGQPFIAIWDIVLNHQNGTLTSTPEIGSKFVFRGESGDTTHIGTVSSIISDNRGRSQVLVDSKLGDYGWYRLDVDSLSKIYGYRHEIYRGVRPLREVPL
jgi:hypothetical protein